MPLLFVLRFYLLHFSFKSDHIRTVTTSNLLLYILLPFLTGIVPNNQPHLSSRSTRLLYNKNYYTTKITISTRRLQFYLWKPRAWAKETKDNDFPYIFKEIVPTPTINGQTRWQCSCEDGVGCMLCIG